MESKETKKAIESLDDEKVLIISLDIPQLGLKKGEEYRLIRETEKYFLIQIEKDGYRELGKVPKIIKMITGKLFKTDKKFAGNKNFTLDVEKMGKELGKTSVSKN